MITVLDNDYSYGRKYYFAENMNVSDTLDNMVLAAYEAANDLVLGTIISEHSYLYENGVEVDYLREGEMADSVKERFSVAVEKVRMWVSDAFNKIIDFITEGIDAVRRQIAKAGLKEDKVKDAIKYLNGIEARRKGFDFGTTPEYKADRTDAMIARYKDEFENGDGDLKWVSPDVYKELTNTAPYLTSHKYSDNKLYNEAGEYYREVEKLANAKLSSDKVDSILETSVHMIFSGQLLKDIKNAKKSADVKLVALKNGWLREKDDEVDDIGDKLDKANKALKSNSNVVKDKIKVYNKFYMGCMRAYKVLVKIADAAYGRANAKATDYYKKKSK